MRHYTTKRILDEFTDLPVSRERKRQLRKNKLGLCRVSGCNRKWTHYEMCIKHRDQHRQRYPRKTK